MLSVVDMEMHYPDPTSRKDQVPQVLYWGWSPADHTFRVCLSCRELLAQWPALLHGPHPKTEISGAKRPCPWAQCGATLTGPHMLSVGLAEALSGLHGCSTSPSAQACFLPLPSWYWSQKRPCMPSSNSESASGEPNWVVWSPRVILESLQEDGLLATWLVMETFVSV